MTDQDKVLINAYFDGETDAQERNTVEELLKNDDDARIFYENLKQIELDIKAFNASEEVAQLSKWTRAYAKKNIESKKGLNDFFKSIFLRNFLGYGLTAAAFFSIGTSIVEDVDYINVGEYDFIVTRSDDSVDKQIKIILDDMITSEISQAKINSTIFNSIKISDLYGKDDCVLFEIQGTRNFVGKYCRANGYYFKNGD